MQILDWCLIVSPEAGIVRGGVGQQTDLEIGAGTKYSKPCTKEQRTYTIVC